MNSISKWKVKTDSMSIPADKGPALDVAAGNIGQLEGAGKTLDSLLNVIEAPVDSKTDTKMNFGFMDPRTILILKAQSAKAVHIKQFITEQCKRRRPNRRKEFIIQAGKDSEELILKPDDEHPYLGIYVEELGAANSTHLLSSGQLPRDEIEFYLTYILLRFSNLQKI